MGCKHSDEDPVVVFISKVYASPLSSNAESIDTGPRIFVPRARNTETAEAQEEEDSTSAIQTKAPTEKFIGFGRIFSGKLKKGQKVYILEPKYNPNSPDKYISEFTVEVSGRYYMFTLLISIHLVSSSRSFLL